MDEMVTLCRSEVERSQNVTAESDLAVDPTTGTLSTQMAVQVQRSICPGQCSGRGTCANSTCTCNAGGCSMTWLDIEKQLFELYSSRLLFVIFL